MTRIKHRAAAAALLGLAATMAPSAEAAAPPLSGIVAVSAGGHHTCALTSAGAVLCWGENALGQLGDGTLQSRPGPVPVQGLSSGVAAISAGDRHTCALMTSGAVRCWGDHFHGQLGDGSAITRTTPVEVSGLAAGVTAIAAGGVHTCAAMAAGGVKCWGDNRFRQLGDGTTNSRSTPVDVNGLGGTPIVALAPTAAPDVVHTCALTASGGVKCWGNNLVGQLGDGTTLERTAVVDALGLDAGIMAIGTANARTCALMASGTMKCWGLRDQDGSIASTPTDDPGFGSGIASFDLGSGGHACLVTTAGGAKCIGRNDRGQLGRGLDEWIGPLGDVTGLASGVAAVAVGNAHSCAVTTAGEMRCWGEGSSGRLGDGISHAIAQPVPVTVRLFSPQSIAFDALAPRDLDASPFALAATASSGLPVSYISLDNRVCTVAGSLVTLVDFGLCTVSALQGGDADYLPATPVMRSFAVRDAVAASVPRPVNISTRAPSGEAALNTGLIGGFIIGGSAPKWVMVRVRGPTLAAFGLASVLADPSIELRSASGGRVAANDNWLEWKGPILPPAGAYIESLGLAPADDREPAIMYRLEPGAYTVVVGNSPGTPPGGVALVEIFEVDRPESPLMNISTRGLVGTGNDVMIAGFVIQGDAPQTVVVRARGPSLAPFGIANPLANPTVELVRSSDGAILAANDNWTSAPNSAAIEASGFAPSHFLESAILVTLPPGAYTAIVRGADGPTGVGIVEVFRQ